MVTEVAARGRALDALIPLLLSTHEGSMLDVQPTTEPVPVEYIADRIFVEDRQRMLETPPATPKGLDCSRLVNEILEEYAYNEDLLPDDIDYLLGVISRRGKRVIDQVLLSAILSSSTLRAWAFIDESSLLLIHGRALTRQESAVSLASAEIVRQMLQSPEDPRNPMSEETSIIPIAFFCGQHRGRDAMSNSNKLISNLLLQLLDRGRHVISEEAVQHCWQDMGAGDTGDFLVAFQNLVTSLPGNTFLTVVVDGIDFFSRTSTSREETGLIVAGLVDLAREGHIEATLKVLFTSSSRPQFVENLFFEDEVLNMPRSIASRGSNRQPNWEFPTSPADTDNGAEHSEYHSP